MQIFIKDLEGRSLCHSCDPLWRVLDLKREFERLRGVPVSLLRLIVNGKQLQDDNVTLRDAGVTPQCTVFTALAGVKGGPMRICVRSFGGTIMGPIEVEPSDTIADVKRKIAREAGVSASSLRLQYAGKEIVPSDSLQEAAPCFSDHGVARDATLALMAPIPGDKMRLKVTFLNEPRCEPRVIAAGEGRWDGSMQIFAETLTGKTITLRVDPSDSIEKVKRQIEEKEGIPCEELRLFHFGRSLSEDARTLSECGITGDATLHIFQRNMICWPSADFYLKGNATVDELRSHIARELQKQVRALKLEGAAEVSENEWVIKWNGMLFWPEKVVDSGGRLKKTEVIPMAFAPDVTLTFDLKASGFSGPSDPLWEVCLGPMRWEALSKKVMAQLERASTAPPVEFTREGASYKVDGVTMMQVNTATGKVRALRRREQPAAAASAARAHSVKRPRVERERDGPGPSGSREGGEGDVIMIDVDGSDAASGDGRDETASVVSQNVPVPVALPNRRLGQTEGGQRDRNAVLFDFFLRQALSPPRSSLLRQRAPPEIASWVSENLQSSVTSHRQALGHRVWCCPPRLEVEKVEVCLPFHLGMPYLMETTRRKENLLRGASANPNRSSSSLNRQNAAPQPDAALGSFPLFSHLPASEFGEATDMHAINEKIHARASATELWLWHGTSDEGVVAVSKDGFDPCRGGEATGSLYGRGTYFAENASKADLYSGPKNLRHRKHSGRMQLLLSLVFVGKRDRRVQPMDVVSQSNRPADGCDSITAAVRAEGGAVDHREFVVFDSKLVVPVFVVTYKHAEGCGCSRCTSA
uniref:Poly [ADP-ribose] polymerase n=1 Tax=Chromera velia CCMP2878 TaxID=1169474 RepID=A0A0G4FZ42_9ALVE|eukprot:Cvel_19347.t1-p1 / transcript=Cvel_19347.t1 / gene=Cvel_19347 / organism=Chromera_velia_CCMP2878 / gene_product=Polyubiquitin-B, putative / transcript_product=Polyubiquitin-B, putative / location=Cvel_scaffold1661:19100-23211(+) / protein_length=812 / sequence_SO=supercontig / SO=protein_coding / is_pseudo=false